MDRARDLFDQLVRDGWQGILDRVNAHESESLILDFKTKADRTKAKVEDADRKTLAKALSAFANMEGGIIVVGVTCRPAPSRDLPDTAQAIEPIDSVAAFEKSVEDNIKQLTDPPIVGYQIKQITDGASPAGILLIYVPESTGRPHRSIIEDRYYARSNTRSDIMPHSQLRAMFGAAAQPVLQIRFRIRAAPQQVTHPDGTGFPVRFDIQIRNEGRGVCRNPALRIEELPGRLQIGAGGRPLTSVWWSSISVDILPWTKRAVFASDGARALAGVMLRSETGYLIYPGESTFIIVPDAQMKDGSREIIFPWGGATITIPLKATLYSENAPPVVFRHDYVFMNHTQDIGDWLTGTEPI
jgi:hypothetical protein